MISPNRCNNKNGVTINSRPISDYGSVGTFNMAALDQILLLIISLPTITINCEELLLHIGTIVKNIDVEGWAVLFIYFTCRGSLGVNGYSEDNLANEI